MSDALKASTQLNNNTDAKEVSEKDTATAKEEGAPITEPIKELLNTSNENTDADLSLEKIIEHFPKRMKTRARLIGGYLANGENPISWNKKGEIFENEKPVLGSSIQDLLYDTACVKRKYSPTGANIFYKQLKDNNIPEGLILNVNRRKLMKQKHIINRNRKSIFKNSWKHY